MEPLWWIAAALLETNCLQKSANDSVPLCLKDETPSSLLIVSCFSVVVGRVHGGLTEEKLTYNKEVRSRAAMHLGQKRVSESVKQCEQHWQCESRTLALFLRLWIPTPPSSAAGTVRQTHPSQQLLNLRKGGPSCQAGRVQKHVTSL